MTDTSNVLRSAVVIAGTSMTLEDLLAALSLIGISKFPPHRMIFLSDHQDCQTLNQRRLTQPFALVPAAELVSLSIYNSKL